MRHAGIASALLVVVAASNWLGCNQKTEPDGAAGAGGVGGGGGGGGGTAAPPANLSCLQVLQCVVDCADPDGPCGEDCYARGTSDAQAKVYDLGMCIETQQCTEETCVYGSCGTELEVCVASSAPPNNGTPLQGNAPPGSVPADLVGAWAGARYGDTVKLTLNADGTGAWEVHRTWQQYACLSFESLVKSGSFVVEPTMMTVYATSVVKSSQTCMPPASETALEPVTEQVSWHRHESDPNVIFIVDSACAAQYPGQENCEYAGCPIGMYCTYRMDRQ